MLRNAFGQQLKLNVESCMGSVGRDLAFHISESSSSLTQQGVVLGQLPRVHAPGDRKVMPPAKFCLPVKVSLLQKY